VPSEIPRRADAPESAIPANFLGRSFPQLRLPSAVIIRGKTTTRGDRFARADAIATRRRLAHRGTEWKRRNVVSALGMTRFAASVHTRRCTRGTAHRRSYPRKVKSRLHCFRDYLRAPALFPKRVLHAVPERTRARPRGLETFRGRLFDHRPRQRRVIDSITSRRGHLVARIGGAGGSSRGIVISGGPRRTPVSRGGVHVAMRTESCTGKRVFTARRGVALNAASGPGYAAFVARSLSVKLNSRGGSTGEDTPRRRPPSPELVLR